MRLTARNGLEKALEAAKAAEFKAIKARAERLSAQIGPRLEQMTAAYHAHYDNKPQEPAGVLASLGVGRAKFGRELADWTQQDMEIKAERQRWGKRLDFVKKYRAETEGWPGRKLVWAKTKRHYPELVRDGQRAMEERTGREVEQQQAERQQRQNQRGGGISH